MIDDIISDLKEVNRFLIEDVDSAKTIDCVCSIDNAIRVINNMRKVIIENMEKNLCQEV